MSVSWDRFRRYHWWDAELGFSVDVSHVRFTDEAFDRLSEQLSTAARAMESLEAGGIANPDEQRMVGHYWLRAPELAPTHAIRDDITGAVTAIRAFARSVHRGGVVGSGGRFEHVAHVGIGGSALGPQLLCEALSGTHDRLAVHVLDNSDPDGVDRLLARLEGSLDRTLVSVVSKSGWTPTTRALLDELRIAYHRAGLPFGRHAVATTMPGSALDALAVEEGWLACFPLWEWVGGRTSISSAVGLLPAALLGADVDALLAGAATMDRLTRSREPLANPAALLAATWYIVGRGRGERNLVVLPYRDRLALFPRYLQQLVMESIGKRLDRHGEVVHQGLTVYGNKGSTDQHAYVQQLRDGPRDFIALLIGVHTERAGDLVELEAGLTLGDHLFGSLQGTRRALWQRGRDSITITIPRLDERSLGALVALHERAVGLYAELIDVNAYHQPGVDKEAALGTLALQRSMWEHLRGEREPRTAWQIASDLGCTEEVVSVFELLEHLSVDPRRGLRRIDGAGALDARFHRDVR